MRGERCRWLSLSSIVEPVGDNVGRERGGGATTMIAGGEVVSLSSSSREGDEGGVGSVSGYGVAWGVEKTNERNRASRFLNSYNQPTDGVHGRGVIRDGLQPWRNVPAGGRFGIVWGGESVEEKKFKSVVALDGHQTTNKR